MGFRNLKKKIKIESAKRLKQIFLGLSTHENLQR